MRQTKTVNNTTTRHIWDGSNIIADVGATTSIYHRGIGLIAKQDGNTVQNYHLNAHGDVVMIGSDTYDYDAFGNQRTSIQSDTNPFRYCGEYFDAETGQIYLRARYYNSVSGRFITEDPIKDGLNWYAYANSNPVMFVDPNGFESIVFYADGMKEQAEVRKKYYEKKYGTTCYIYYVSSAEAFIHGWNDIKYWTAPVDAIEVISHGTIKGETGKDRNGNLKGTGAIYFGEGKNITYVYARSTSFMNGNDRDLGDITTYLYAKEINIESCNSANPDAYNFVFRLMQISYSKSYTGFDGGARWDPSLGDHVRGGGDYSIIRFWDPYELVRKYQETWWKYVPKKNGTPTRERTGRRYFYN